jgi:hypothetical protein
LLYGAHSSGWRDGAYLLTTLGTKKEFKDIPCKPTWNAASYLLFSSLADKKTAYFIDNVKLEQK